MVRPCTARKGLYERESFFSFIIKLCFSALLFSLWAIFLDERINFPLTRRIRREKLRGARPNKTTLASFDFLETNCDKPSHTLIPCINLEIFLSQYLIKYLYRFLVGLNNSFFIQFKTTSSFSPKNPSVFLFFLEDIFYVSFPIIILSILPKKQQQKNSACAHNLINGRLTKNRAVRFLKS